MNARTIGGILVLVFLVGILMYKRTQPTISPNQVARAVGWSNLRAVEGYEANKEYLDLKADLAHKVAFTKAYKRGLGDDHSTFDKKVYEAEFLDRMIHETRKDGRQDLANAIAERRKRL